MENLNISQIQIDTKIRTSKNENLIFIHILDVFQNSKNNKNISQIKISHRDFKKLTTEEIKDNLIALMGKNIEISYKSNENFYSIIFPLINSFTQIDDYFIVTIPNSVRNAFYKDTLEYQFSLKTFFYLRQKSAINFFNLLIKEIIQEKSLVLTLNELKNIFKVKEDSYERFFDFEKVLLKPLTEKINSCSDFAMIYEKIKKGENKNNKVTAIKFTIQNSIMAEKTAETNYLIQIIKDNINDFQKIWDSINSTITRLGFEKTKRIILFLKENSLKLSDEEFINYLNKKGENIEEILHLNNHTLIKEKMALYKNSKLFIKTIYEIMIGYDFYYSLNFKFLNKIKDYEEGKNFYYKDETYVIFGSYFENKGSFKIFEANQHE